MLTFWRIRDWSNVRNPWTTTQENVYALKVGKHRLSLQEHPQGRSMFLGDRHPIKKDESDFTDGNTEEKPEQKDREDRIQMFRIARQEGCSIALPYPFSPRGAVIFSSSSPIYDLIGISKFR